MTKSLTEQWKDGTLKQDFYYVKCAFDDDVFVSFIDYEIYDKNHLPAKEVLAPVPSYDKLKEMIDGDKETIRHLKKILPAIKDTVNYDYLKLVIEDFEKSIKDFEGVK